MLFSNPLAISSELDLHQLRQLKQCQITTVELQLPEQRYTMAEIRELLQFAELTPLALRMPTPMGLGVSSLQTEEWKYWLDVASQILDKGKGYLIVHGATVPFGSIFEYFNARPTDFNALHDFKTAYIERMISQIRMIYTLLGSSSVQILVENAPMGGHHYFEPGRSLIHPALRTPHHLLQIVEATPAKLCFDTAHARITSNVLTYMHRSRSLFAGATEREVMSATKTWVDFYEQVKPHVAMVRLGSAISWGDTTDTCHIPFTPETYEELLDFAEKVDGKVPISLSGGDQLQQMVQTLHELKRC